jgi:hypothetical protein
MPAHLPTCLPSGTFINIRVVVVKIYFLVKTSSSKWNETQKDLLWQVSRMPKRK